VELVVRFESVPAGAAVLLDGMMVCKETPCSKRVTPGSQQVEMQAEQYYPASQTVLINKATPVVRLELAPTFGVLTVTTTPPGLPFKLDGKTLDPASRSPQRLAPGVHRVLLADPCFAADGEEFVITEGKDKRLDLVARPLLSALKVEAEDAQGNAVRAEVKVDGKRVGVAPGPFKLPVCSAQVEVIPDNGEAWSTDLSLKAKKTTTLRPVFHLRSQGAEQEWRPGVPGRCTGSPGEEVALYERGQGLLDEGDLPTATACFEEALRLGHREVSLYLDLAYVSRQLGDAKKAKKYYRLVLDAPAGEGGGQRTVRFQLAKILEEEEDWTAAIREYETILRADPNNAQAQSRLKAAIRERNRGRNTGSSGD